MWWNKRDREIIKCTFHFKHTDIYTGCVLRRTYVQIYKRGDYLHGYPYEVYELIGKGWEVKYWVKEVTND